MEIIIITVLRSNSSYFVRKIENLNLKQAFRDITIDINFKNSPKNSSLGVFWAVSYRMHPFTLDFTEEGQSMDEFIVRRSRQIHENGTGKLISRSDCKSITTLGLLLEKCHAPIQCMRGLLAEMCEGTDTLVPEAHPFDQESFQLYALLFRSSFQELFTNATADNYVFTAVEVTHRTRNEMIEFWITEAINIIPRQLYLDRTRYERTTCVALELQSLLVAIDGSLTAIYEWSYSTFNFPRKLRHLELLLSTDQRNLALLLFIYLDSYLNSPRKIPKAIFIRIIFAKPYHH